jgi:hypothetical protein
MFDHLDEPQPDAVQGEPDGSAPGQSGLDHRPDADVRNPDLFGRVDCDDAGDRSAAADGDDVAGARAADDGGPADYAACDVDEVGVALEQVVGLQSACTLQYLRLVADLDRREVWKADGQATMANWLALRFKLARSTARTHTRIAAVIDDLPAIAEAYGVGQISFDQLDALCQLADADSEQDWLREAHLCDPETLRRFVRRRRVRDESAKEIRDRRGISFRPDAQAGVTRLHGILEASDAEVVRTELDRLASQNATADPDTGVYPTVPQQRADALVGLCGLGLAADGDLDRATVVVHGDVGLLTGENPDGHATLADQMPIAATAFQRLACDGRLEWAVDGPDGTTLGIGRAERQWPPWLVRYIRRRDAQTCRFPGCSAPIHHIHHIDGWTGDLGGTDDTNGIGLCWDPPPRRARRRLDHHRQPQRHRHLHQPPNRRPFLSPCPGITQHTLDLLDAPPHTHGRDPTHRNGHTHRGPPDRDAHPPSAPTSKALFHPRAAPR